ncbi:interferon regulatory factor 8 [Lingula anatina]|uniref:Interferon regulatory factor 8 n=1 Tax=Lingula anatina TaxID=7574 RepID=A0A1S3HBZ8_LINAN|nr:interferon regulatory factor 8 [Lingula anatina]|eukprot:XP_013382679.2 interferon regulatory factor 8 [Lingula anatina]
MSVNRQRLRPWLEAQINSGRVPGLRWLDRDHTIFRIPWKHGGKQGWREEDSLIFKNWAEHTGRFRKGIDQPDYATWKTRLRMALNRAPKIQELRTMSRPDDEDPFRVYRFLTATEKGDSSTCLTENDSNLDEDNGTWIPLNLIEPPSMMSIDEEWANINSDDLVKCDSLDQQKYVSGGHAMMPVQPEMSVGMTPVSGVTDHDSDVPKGILGQSDDLQIAGHQMLVKLFYLNSQVAQYEMNNPNGSRLYYNSSYPGTAQHMAEIAQTYAGEMRDQLFGPSVLNHYLMPPPKYAQGTSQHQSTKKILESMERGLLLQCINGDIYLTRLCRVRLDKLHIKIINFSFTHFCRCVIFCSSPSKGEQIFKVKRDNMGIKIFDFTNYFLPAVDRYVQGQGPCPRIEVRLGFGQTWSSDDWSRRDTFISATVVSAKALQIIQQLSSFQLGCQPTPMFSIEISGSDDFDRIAETIKKLCELKTSNGKMDTSTSGSLH